uniref:Saposin B-type domain-containing protein n=1 Tax=Arion vulgaris TaxID=1028688 RepID=A0A0B6Y0C2_9EUPU
MGASCVGYHCLTNNVAIILLVWGCIAAVCQGVEEDSQVLLNDTSKALNLAILFLKEDFAEVNVDGLFGTQMCQGCIIQALNDCSGKPFNCPADLIALLTVYRNELQKIAYRAMPYIQIQDLEYFERFKSVINSPFMIQYIPERLGATRQIGTKGEIDFIKSDVCLSSLLGTYVDPKSNKTLPKCSVRDDCVEYMTQPGTSEYFLTHQLLYFIFVENAGCVKQAEEQLLKINVEHLSFRETQKRLCKSILAEALEEDKDGHVNVIREDLFIEQGMLCGVIGFEEFLTKKWIRKVLSWQTPKGCFGLTSEDIEKNRDNMPASWYTGIIDRQDVNSDVKPDVNSDVKTGRKLLTEKKMNGDCLSHKTGIGIGVIGVYLRYLIRAIYGP